MTDYRDTDARLADYSAAFDFYMESGQLPPTADPDDALMPLVEAAAQTVPTGPGTDPEMPGIVRQAAVSLLGELVGEFGAIQEQAQQEIDLIDRFEAASVEEKRRLWPQVSQTISKRYSVLEVNLPGYVKQFATDDREAVFAALIGDWRTAAEERLRQMLSQNSASRQRRFSAMLQASVSADYEEQRRVRSIMARYPALPAIIDAIGRDKESPTEEIDSVIYRFIPQAVARNSALQEIDRVEGGDSLARVLPAELSMPDEIFYKRFASKELQQFASPGADRPRRTEEHHPAPRLQKGPIIVAVDTSGSMLGSPLEIAFSLVSQLTALARRQNRPCYLISFSIRTTAIDLSLPSSRLRLSTFLSGGFTGGTSGEQMLSEGIRMLSTKTYEMADMLIISDLQFAPPANVTTMRIRREQALGTRFYALQIGRQPHFYSKILDRVWQV